MDDDDENECDICSNTLDYNSKNARCEKCDYDICSKCMKKDNKNIIKINSDKNKTRLLLQ